MRVTPKMAAAMKATRMRELRALGYTSDIFPAKYTGTCGCGCGVKYGPYRGDAFLCYFTGFERPILSPCATRIVDDRRRAAAPKCGCGHVATVEPADRRVSGSPYTLCNLCCWVCEHYFELCGDEVTRDSMPILPV